MKKILWRFLLGVFRSNTLSWYLVLMGKKHKIYALILRFAESYYMVSFPYHKQWQFISLMYEEHELYM